MTKSTGLPPGCPPLTRYYFYLTAGCNLACKHCWLAPDYQANGTTGGHIEYDLFVQAIEEGVPLGLQGVKFTGGEPLLHPDFERMATYLAERGLGVEMESNATLLTRSTAEFLRDKTSLRFISVSLDGACSETHDPFRGVKGSFDKTVAAIKHLVDVGIRPQIIMSVHRGNVDEVEALSRFGESLGASSIKFNMIQPTGRGETMKARDQVLRVEDLLRIGQWVENELQDMISIPLLYGWPVAFHSLRRLNRSVAVCGIHNILGVLADGQLAMCGIGTAIPELCYGKIGETPVADVWGNHPILMRLRQEVPGALEGICEECLFRDRCKGGCIAENYHQTARLTAPFWLCSMADSAGLFPTTRRREAGQVVNA